MKLFKLIGVLALVGCGGQEFTAATNVIGVQPNEAGAAGEGGEDNAAGMNSGGSTSDGGSSSNKGGGTTGGTDSAGKDAGGSAGSGGTVSSAGTAGKDTGGTAGVAGSSGSGGTNTTVVNPCSTSMNSAACEGRIWDSNGTIVPATHPWECPEVTDQPPYELKAGPNGSTVRQCTESKFGAPNTLWCCTS